MIVRKLICLRWLGTFSQLQIILRPLIIEALVIQLCTSKIITDN